MGNGFFGLAERTEYIANRDRGGTAMRIVPFREVMCFFHQSPTAAVAPLLEDFVEQFLFRSREQGSPGVAV